MDFKNIEKRSFACVLIFSLLIALVSVLVNSLLELSELYLLSFGFSEKELILINIAIVVGLIAVTALSIDVYLKSFFQKRNEPLSLNKIPMLVTNCVSEFVKGYRN